MKIIDTNTGQELHVGLPFDNVNGQQVITRASVGLFGGKVLVKRLRSDWTESGWPIGESRWVPLQVRYLHPGFPLQKVAFYPS